MRQHLFRISDSYFHHADTSNTFVAAISSFFYTQYSQTHAKQERWKDSNPKLRQGASYEMVLQKMRAQKHTTSGLVKQIPMEI